MYLITSTSFSILIVSERQVASILIVSCIFWTLILTFSETISRTIVSETTIVSARIFSCVTIVVSSLTIVSVAIEASFFTALFKWYWAEHEERKIKIHKNRILLGFQCCKKAVQLSQVLQWNHWSCLRNRVWSSCAYFCFGSFEKRSANATPMNAPNSVSVALSNATRVMPVVNTIRPAIVVFLFDVILSIIFFYIFTSVWFTTMTMNCSISLSSFY